MLINQHYEEKVTRISNEVVVRPTNPLVHMDGGIDKPKGA